jgi:hypothetical protein
LVVQSVCCWVCRERNNQPSTGAAKVKDDRDKRVMTATWERECATWALLPHIFINLPEKYEQYIVHIYYVLWRVIMASRVQSSSVLNFLSENWKHGRIRSGRGWALPRLAVHRITSLWCRGHNWSHTQSSACRQKININVSLSPPYYKTWV